MVPLVLELELGEVSSRFRQDPAHIIAPGDQLVVIALRHDANDRFCPGFPDDARRRQAILLVNTYGNGGEKEAKAMMDGEEKRKVVAEKTEEVAASKEQDEGTHEVEEMTKAAEETEVAQRGRPRDGCVGGVAVWRLLEAILGQERDALLQPARQRRRRYSNTRTVTLRFTCKLGFGTPIAISAPEM